MLKEFILFTLLSTVTLIAKPIVYDFKTIDRTQWQQTGTWDLNQTDSKHPLSLLTRSKGDFNLCYTRSVSLLDSNLSVSFRANAGSIDQGGGLMWRVQDGENYYVARFNPLEDNFRFYIVHAGLRSQLASAEVKLSAGWHTMRIEQKGERLKGYLDNKLYLEHSDKQLAKAGGVGVWTKADAQTSFSALTIEGGK